MKVKKNKGNRINFANVKMGTVIEDNDGNIYLKIGTYKTSNKDLVNALDLETNFLCYIDPKEIVYPYKKAYISLEN